MGLEDLYRGVELLDFQERVDLAALIATTNKKVRPHRLICPRTEFHAPFPPTTTFPYVMRSIRTNKKGHRFTVLDYAVRQQYIIAFKLP